MAKKGAIGNKTPWGPLGEVIYLRTYSRFDEERKRRESWPETVDRVVEYSLSLAPSPHKGEATILSEAMLGLKGFPAGRTLWIGGSNHAKEFPIANYNCSFLDFKEAKDAYEAVILLMSGSGVGFRVTQDNVSELDKNLPLKGFVEVSIEPYKYVGSPGQLEETRVEFSDDRETLRLVVGDSREGWAQAISTFLLACSYNPPYERVKRIVINTDYVRPLGERLRRFGGYASGPQVLVDFFLDAQRVLFRNPRGAWTQTKGLDIMNLIGRTVVAGGTRRCLPAGTLVYTERGAVPIEDVAPGTKVMTLRGWASVTDHMYQGRQKTVGIETAYGVLFATENHRLAVYTNGGLAWIEAGKLPRGSYMVVFAGSWYPGEAEKLFSDNIDKELESLEVLNEQVLREFSRRPLGDRLLLLALISPDFSAKEGGARRPRHIGDSYAVITLPRGLFSTSAAKEFLLTLGVFPDGNRGFGGRLSESGEQRFYVFGAAKALLEILASRNVDPRSAVEEVLSSFNFGEQAFIPVPVLGVFPGPELDTYDLTVADDHMFVANGFLVHNSAQIALGDDLDFAKAKTGEWWSTHPWRTSSNNSILFTSRPSVSDLEDLLTYAYEFGEPGFINAETASRRRDNFRGVNPCSEILLDDSGVCNLVTLNLMAFAKSPSWNGVDWQDLFLTARALTRHAIRIALLEFPEGFERWNLVQERDRLIGVSFTGYGNFVDYLNLTPSQQSEFLKKLREVIHKEAKEYATWLGIREPIPKTTVKPEGTISLLPGVSHGVHPDWAPYYFRRVRMSKVDAVAQALKALGMTPYPAPETGAKTLEEAHTWVYEFPVKSPAKKTTHEYTALEQLERYKMVMRDYVDHNVSITVNFERHEIPEIARWIYENWDHYVGISFLRKDASVYPLQPLEAITEEQYKVAKLLMPDLSRLKETVDAIERGDYQATDDLDPSCATGVCPVR